MLPITCRSIARARRKRSLIFGFIEVEKPMHNKNEINKKEVYMKKITFISLLILAFILLSCELPPEDTLYSITYHGNGNTYGYPPNEYTTGMEAVVLDKGTLIKTGNTFLHWNTRSDGTGSSYSSGDTITINYTNIFLYAIWVE